MFILTPTQRNLVILIAIVMGVDAGISIYSAWFHNAVFFEANPLFAVLKTVEWFTAGAITIKIIAMILVLYLVSTCNTVGISWGDSACYGGLFTVSFLVGLLTLINTIYPHIILG